MINSKMKRPLKGLFTSCLLLFGLVANAQSTFKVSGKILDASDEALIGATVVVKGNPSQGTIADIEGNYVLSLPAGDHTLIYTFIGYQSYEEAVSGEAGDEITISPVLSQDEQLLEEVVVIGYGTAKKEDIAGAVTSVSSEDFNKGVIVSPQQLLEGKISGVQISSSSGEPGAGMNIKIRGTNSFRGGGPLFVVDGIPLSGNSNPDASIDGVGNRGAQNPLAFLDPADIQSIQVLKDASATAIYGSRASNGVVIIETKTGGSGEPVLEYSNYLSVSSVSKKLDLLNGDQYREQQSLIAGNHILSQANSIDWQDLIFREAFASSHNLSFRAGDKRSSFGVSLGMLDQQGIIESNEYKRYTGKVNGKSSFLEDRWTIGVTVQVSRVDNAGVPISSSGTGDDLLTHALQANPTAENFSLYIPSNGALANPITFLEAYRDDTRTDRVLANMSSNIKIIDGLELTSKFAADISNGHRVVVTDPVDIAGFDENGRVLSSNRSNTNFLVDNYATYSKFFNKLEFKLMGGYSVQKFRNERSSATYSGILEVFNDSDGLIEQDYADTYDMAYQLQYLTNPISWDGQFEEFTLSGLIGRLNLNWDNKYLLEGAVRRDGSTRFDEENRYGTFPSAAFKWKIHNESFLNNVTFLSELGMRASWGESGNQSIPTYSNQLVRRVPNSSIPGGIETQYGNPYLIWETTTQSNIGVDFSFYDKRVYGNVDYFVKTTNDLLTQESAILVLENVGIGIPITANEVWQNSSSTLETKGFEFVVGGFPIINDKITWDVSANLTSLATIGKNLDREILTGRLGGGGMSGTLGNVYQEGEELSFNLREFVRIDENGTAIYLDEDGNETDNSGAAQRNVGSVFPDFTFGINSTLYYGNWDFSMSWTGAKGLKLFNNTEAAILKYSDLANGQNTTVGTIGSNQTLTSGNIGGLSSSTYFLEDADYIRLNNLQIGYTLPSGTFEMIKSLRLYVTGQNLLLFTEYSGYDPDVNTNNSTGGFPSVGIDYSNYPKSRAISFGLNVSF